MLLLLLLLLSSEIGGASRLLLEGGAKTVLDVLMRRSELPVRSDHRPTAMVGHCGRCLWDILYVEGASGGAGMM